MTSLSIGNAGNKKPVFLQTTRITTKILYNRYVEKYPDCNLTYNQFKDIVVTANKLIVDRCLEGGIYNFGHSVGTWCITKFNRKPYIDDEGKLKNVSVDFGATRKAKAAGKDVVIYHDTTLICKWTWHKTTALYGRIPNKDKWCIEPTNGPKGISRKLHHYIEANEHCTLKYEFLEVAKDKIK